MVPEAQEPAEEPVEELEERAELVALAATNTTLRMETVPTMVVKDMMMVKRYRVQSFMEMHLGFSGIR